VADATWELAPERLADRLTALAFRPDDRAATMAIARQALGSAALIAEIDRLADLARSWLGKFPSGAPDDRWTGYHPATDPLGEGLLPLLALVVTAPDLAAWHRGRGVPAAISKRTLGELGQQVWVHRTSFSFFGLRSFGWLPVTWCGSLYWLGRLQFNLLQLDDEWVCSTHIPRSGPLDPTAVDAAFRHAAQFFPAYFPDFPVTDFWCQSWLLALDLAAELPAASNIAGFQRRWRLDGQHVEADEDLLLFVFGRRPDADLESLPRTTTLERVVGDRLRSGGHWSSWSGRISMPDWAP
jgi:hypothetical protein